ncbi:MAG: hypothetical protein FWG44_06360 [Oscillospiraceae bacterium]|nr:hypothetical protein [Oscillospiraceae bacterium]
MKKFIFILLIIFSCFLSACGERIAESAEESFSESDEEVIEIDSLPDEQFIIEEEPEEIPPTAPESPKPEQEEILYSLLLDIDSDGIEEKTEYFTENNSLVIARNNEIVSKFSLHDAKINFNGIGMHVALYYFEYVNDSNNNVLLHTYATSYIGNIDEKRYIMADEQYFEFNNGEFTPIDIINYQWVYSGGDSISERIGIKINGEETDSLESIEQKYTAIENTYFEIPY